MTKVNIERRFEIRERTVFDVSETIIKIEAADGAENAQCSQEIGRSATFRSKEEAEEYASFLRRHS
ncbi:hypothetical protein [Acetobacter senegalensis]|uniref:hypothetical protein n=1 Tax=Acetobacter senegalensis TaxID=446692 RepID=UPI001EE09B25|nr:hypothetical protein [Acetobacter senegalensis]MCG4273894.1 hypothetical protein [Acetobacter senegalensis]